MINQNQVDEQLSLHILAQERAKSVLDKMVVYIKTGMAEQEILLQCLQLLNDHHLSQTWYYNVPALVYVGCRTTLSMSGREYRPTDTTVKNNDIVTIALSPSIDNHWGALARTFIIQNGKVFTGFDRDDDYASMIKFQHQLHHHLIEIAKQKMRFYELYQYMNDYIQSAGYTNLDYHGNLGHSLEDHLSKRKFIEEGNQTLLGECKLFAFETHIGKAGQPFGSKHENIYYFKQDQLHAMPILS